LYLGISFGGWGVPMAFSAVTSALPRVAWVLFMAAVVWAVIYDTIYAMIDREDDLKIGVKSSAVLFADMDRVIIGIMQVMMLYALYLAGASMHFGAWYYAGMALAGLSFLWQQWLIRKRDPANCMRAFLNNNYVGMVIFVGIMLDHLYRPT
jgi:4-hydroxybenzoate polyprenyltransferase